MAKSKLILPDDPEWKQPLVMGDAYKQGLTPKTAAAKRVAEAEDSESGTFKYALSAIAHHPDPWMKTAQLTGVSNMMTQPMWFSPLHTPQNWQIASKRREIYQWSFIGSNDQKPCYLVNYGDFTLEDIRNVYTKWQNDFRSRDQMYIQNDKGEKSQPDFCTKRYVEKRANRIKAVGIPHALEVTHDHKCIIIKREDVKCSKGVSKTKNCIVGVNAPTCINLKCDRYKTIDYKISTIDAQDVKKGDYVLCPFPTEIKESIIKTKEQARFAGHLASDGCVAQTGTGVRIFMNPEEEDYVIDSSSVVFDSFDAPVNPKMAKDGSQVATIRSGKKIFHEFASSLVKGVKENKRYTDEVMLLDPELQKHVLGAYIQSDGSCNIVHEQIEITTVSKNLANQLQVMFHRCGILSFSSKQPISSSKGTYPTKNKFRYFINIPKTFVYTLQDYVPGKIPKCIYKPAKCIYKSPPEDDTLFVKNDQTCRRISKRFFWKNYVVSPVTSNTSFDYKGDVYDIRMPPTYAVTANGIAVHNCRFFYDNEPKVAAAIDFYSRFPMNGFDLVCPSRKVLSYFEHHVSDRLKLNENFKMMSSEYFMLGDVFIHSDIECKKCKGTAIDEATGEPCDHEGGSFKKLRILNPDWIEVQQNVMSDEPSIVFVPDEELKRIVFYRQPKNVYERIPDPIKQLVLQNKPIPLSNRTTSHLKHMPVPYGTYGSSLIRRLFTTLAYKTKIMTANWIVAERLILPVRVVQIGSDNRPASAADIADIQQQLAATANDPNLTIVTHHNFAYEWYGACHDEKTEVLTDSGFRTYDQVDITKDKVLCYNVYTKALECIYATEKHVYDYDGEMICFKGKQVDIKVTPNHKMLTRRNYNQQWKTKRADEIVANDRFLSHGMYVHSEDVPKYVYIQDHKILLKKFLKYIGYYVSEGSITWDTKRRDYIVNIHQSPEANPEFCDDIYSAAVSTGLKVCVVKSQSKNTYKIHKKSLCEYMEKNFGRGSYNKKLALWVKQLPPEYLKILLTSLNNGDGTTRPNQHTTQFVYTTASKTLANDVQEIALKCDYHVNIALDTYTPGKVMYKVRMSKGKWSKGHEPRIKKNHISRCHYKGKVWCFTVPTGFFVTRRNGKITIQGNSGKILQVTQEMEYIGKEILDGFMLNQSLLNGEMSGYQSAQVGVETLIRRIESWRHTLADWCEENIFKPVAEMQGFIDEEKSEEVGETVFLYPEIKWNDLNLKDKSQYHQLLNQLHDKQLISAQTLLEEIDIDYDQEVKRMRYEQTQAGPGGGALGMGSPGGDMGMGMGGGGMGGAPMGGGMPGAEMGGMGAPMGGEMGGMGAPPMGGVGGGGGAPMASAGGGGKIMKAGKDKATQKQDEMAMENMPMIKLTSIEQKLADILMGLAPMYKLNPQQDILVQFPVENPHNGPPYQLDFALPKFKLDLEADGEAWHSNPEQSQDDKQRDYTLAQRGWTILRFDDKVIEDAPQAVRNTIGKHIQMILQNKGNKQAVSQPKLYTYANGDIKDISGEYDKFTKVSFKSDQGSQTQLESFSTTNYNDQGEEHFQ